jgi:hypothetical protein
MIEIAELPLPGVLRFLEETWRENLASLMGAGFSDCEADLNVERNKSQLLEGEHPKLSHHFLDIWYEGISVGTLWLASQDD